MIIIINCKNMDGKTHPEYQYLNLLKEIMENGAIKKEFNTGTELKSVFGRQIRFNLREGFPLLTTKKVFWKGIVIELLWFLKGDSNIKFLVDNNVHIWDEWAYKKYKEYFALKGKNPELTQEEFIEKIKQDNEFAKKWGDLGPIYGTMWRKWPASDGRKIDQLSWAIEKLKTHPQRKHYIVSAWNPEFIYEMAASREKSVVLPPCHVLYHLNVSNNKLNLLLYQRSADAFLGVPFNIASYSLLLLLIAKITGYEPGDFVHTFGDIHVYSNHYEQVKEQIKREPLPFPSVKISDNVKDLDNIKLEDIVLENYKCHPPLKGDVVVVGGF